MLVPRPPDWAGEVGICGFLFPPSDSAKNYEPPEGYLCNFHLGKRVDIFLIVHSFIVVFIK